MVQTDFALHLLVVTLAAPARLGEAHQLREGYFRLLARDGAKLKTAVKQADAEAQAGGVREVVLAWENTEKSRPFLALRVR